MSWHLILCLCCFIGALLVVVLTLIDKDFPPKFKPGQTFKDYK